MRQQRSSAQHKGFSLVEVVIAIGIVAILLTSFMAVFGPAQQNIVRALGVADVSRLTSTLENEMSYLRNGEQNEYQDATNNSSAFQKSYEWISESNAESTAIIVYQYHASSTGTANADGTLPGVSSSTAGTPGVDYITQTIARKLGTGGAQYVTNELAPGVVVGSVYAVRMTQLVEDTNGGLILGAPGTIVNPDNSDPNVATPTASDAASYTGAHIAVQAEFFLLPNNLSGFVTGAQWEFEKLGEPVVTQNIALRK